MTTNTNAASLTYLSFGAGVQSTAMLVMSALGDHGVPKADVAFFADTGDEPKYVYDAVTFYTEWGRLNGIEVKTGSAGRLSNHVLTHRYSTGVAAVSIPAFVGVSGEGKGVPIQRQCTADFKVDVVSRMARAIVGRKRTARAVNLLGISLDEAHRAKDSRIPWITRAYPLLDAGLTRDDCVAYLRDKGLPVPQKSACVFCPYHSDTAWKEMRDAHPDEFAKAVWFDSQIRDLPTKLRGKLFLHRSLLPLADAIGRNDDQGDLFGSECEGVCGV